MARLAGDAELPAHHGHLLTMVLLGHKTNPGSRLSPAVIESPTGDQDTPAELPMSAYAEFPAQPGNPRARTGEVFIPDSASLGCVQCYLPLVQQQPHANEVFRQELPIIFCISIPKT